MNLLIIEIMFVLETCILMAWYSALLGSMAGFLVFTFVCPILFVSEREIVGVSI